MLIKDMFKKPIDRDIKGVIVVGEGEDFVIAATAAEESLAPLAGAEQDDALLGHEGSQPIVYSRAICWRTVTASLMEVVETIEVRGR